ncbi:MAG TPA: THUMP domain-containing protein [Salinivirgaceae bacterium]|nr:THUMP domain-containing protein [Salinivirgaceae bacterium]HQA76347.1 THUMP domain-containing protein [Salinivirgaceae bacterium]
MEKFDIIATTLYGLENVLAEELNAIGATDISVLNRAVKFRGNNHLLYKSNLWLRTAIKILKPIHAFRSNNERQLYSNIKQFKWENYLSIKKSFAVDSVVNSNIFTHSQYVALKVKDAIVDRFRDSTELRPSVDTENPDIRINIHISGTMVIVSLDSSGEMLGKRGYRTKQVEAPISEVLAAGIILLSGWDKKTDVIDPMCGSGTFPIEAAMIAANIAPGLNRKFNFETWLDFDKQLFDKIKKEAVEKQISSSAQIYGSDINKKAISISINNARRAGVRDIIKFENKDFFDSENNNKPAFIFMNPPYDERLQIEKVEEFYDEIGSQLKHHYQNNEAWIISSNFEAIKRFGLKAEKKIKLFNGKLECRLLHYKMYEGSKKNKDKA